MPKRKVKLKKGYIYHVLNRGVASQNIYKTPKEYKRFIYTLMYYQYANPPLRYSFYIKQGHKRKQKILKSFQLDENLYVEILCYCLMPNHYHLLIRQVANNGIAEFARLTGNSYSKYFNTKHKRSGPLFQGRFKAKRIKSDEQLLHVSRYIHLNPYSASLVDNFSQLLKYPYSSLNEYSKNLEWLCYKKPILEHFKDNASYIKFVKNNADYQKSLQQIKKLNLE